MRIAFNKVEAIYTIEWVLPMAPLPGEVFRDSRENTYTVLSTDGDSATFSGPCFPDGWLEPVKENWAHRTFEHHLADLWASVECLDFTVHGATVPSEFVVAGEGLESHMVLWNQPVSFLPLESIGSVHVLIHPVPEIQGDFSGANLRGKGFDRLDLTFKGGRISAIEREVEVDTKAVKTKLWVGDFQHACHKAIRMAYDVLADRPLVIEHILGPSGG